MTIFKGSRYERSKLYNFLHAQKGLLPTIGARKPLKLPHNAEVIQHQVGEGDTLDHLAYRYLDDAGLWWVILDINPRYVTPFQVVVGDILVIPTPATLRRALDDL